MTSEPRIFVETEFYLNYVGCKAEKVAIEQGRKEAYCFTLTMQDVKPLEAKALFAAYIEFFTLTMWDVKPKELKEIAEKGNMVQFLP